VLLDTTFSNNVSSYLAETSVLHTAHSPNDILESRTVDYCLLSPSERQYDFTVSLLGSMESTIGNVLERSIQLSLD